MEDHFEYCAALVREADRDRYLATLFAPADERGALFALYAFNAEISRVRALAREPMPAEIRLQWWHEVILGERAGEAAANPVAAALLATLSRHRLPAEELIGLIEARRFDIYDEPIVSLAELKSYAAKSAATIFELAAHILTGGLTSAIKGVAAEAGQAQTIADMLALLPQHAARRSVICSPGFASALSRRGRRCFRDARDAGGSRGARRASFARPPASLACRIRRARTPKKREAGVPVVGAALAMAA